MSEFGCVFRLVVEVARLIAITTYQAGKLAMLGWRENRASVLMRQFTRPMGLAVGPGKLALATKHEITVLGNAPLLASDLLPDQRDKYNALYHPRAN